MAALMRAYDSDKQTRRRRKRLPTHPQTTPPPVAPLPEAGQQAIVDAVLAALAAQQQTNPPPIGTATRSGPTASAAGSGQAVGRATR